MNLKFVFIIFYYMCISISHCRMLHLLRKTNNALNENVGSPPAVINEKLVDETIRSAPALKNEENDKLKQSEPEFKIYYTVGKFTADPMKQYLMNLTGILNQSDIETMYIIATTLSNNPPQQMRLVRKQSMPLNTLTSRSNLITDNVFDSDEMEEINSEFRRINDDDDGKRKLKTNPSIIEGPPPSGNLVKQNNPLIVEPKAFESDESNSDSDEEQVKEEIASSVSSSEEDKDMEKNSPQVAMTEVSTKTSTSTTHAIVDESTDKLIPELPLLSTSPKSIIPPVSTGLIKNIKKVNQYLIDRAQDALDIIRHPTEKSNIVAQSPKGKLLNDDNEHSDLTKNLIADFKKMPEFVLGQVKDSLNKVNDNQPNDDNKIDVITEETKAIDMPISKKVDANIVGSSVTPNTQPLMTKLEKYLAEQKEKRQQMYPLKIKDTTTTTTSTKLSDTLGIKLPSISNIDTTLTEAEPPKINLKEKLRNFLDENKLKALDKIKFYPSPKSIIDDNTDNTPRLKSRINEDLNGINGLKSKLSSFSLNKNQNTAPLSIDETAKTVLQSSKNVLKNNIEDANARRELLKSKFNNYIARLKSSRTSPSNSLLLGESAPVTTTTESIDIQRKDNEMNGKPFNFMESRLGMNTDNIDVNQNDIETIDEKKSNEVVGSTKVECQNESQTCKGKYHNIGSILIDKDNTKKFVIGEPSNGLPIKLNNDGKKIELLLDLEQLCQCRLSGNNSSECSSTKCQKNKSNKNIVDSFEFDEMKKGNEKSDVAKRSTELNENHIDLPQLTEWNNIVHDLSNIGKQIKRSFSDSVQRIGNELEEIEAKKLITKNLFDKHPSLLGNNLEEKIHTILKPNNYETNEINSKLLNNKIYPNLIGKIFDKPSLLDLNRNSIFTKSKSSLLGNKLIEINDNLEKIPSGQHVRALRRKLEELDNKVEKFNKENEQMVLNESKNLLNDKKINSSVDGKEVNLLNNVLSWIKDVATIGHKK